MPANGFSITRPPITPAYDVASLTHRPEIIAANGLRHTCHAGAYLYDGLHEGAVRSAKAVADKIGPASNQWVLSNPAESSPP